jgi:hypothetical protein
MPLVFSYVYLTLCIVVSVLGGYVLKLPMHWWYGWPTATGRAPGASTWFGRAVNIASAVWFAMWWWEAARAALGRPGAWARLVVVGAALGAAAALYIEYLVYWGRWGMV